MKTAIAVSVVVLALVARPVATRGQSAISPREIDSLRAAIEDLRTSFGPRYPKAEDYLRQLDAVVQSAGQGVATAGERFSRLRQEALLANPLLEDLQLLVVKRKPQVPGRGGQPPPGLGIGMPSNHECNTSLKRQDFDNEIAILQSVRPEGRLSTLYRPPHRGYVGELDLHEDGKRFLFTQSDAENWKVWELGVDGQGLRQVSQAPADVDCFDACYLPDGRIVLGSTASFQAVPCWHGLRRVSNLYRMNADGTGMRQLCFDQDHDLHPTVVANGQVMYSRWDYTGINHIFLRELMVMNPDGTGQRALYGSNSWFPNSLYFPRVLPDEPNQFVCILSGYHGPHRMGQLVLVDTRRGWHEAAGLVQRISGRGDPIRPQIRDNLIGDDWPKFLHPYPLSAKHFLVAGWTDPQSPWRIYLADVFDNLVPVREEPGYALLEPVPIRTVPAAPQIPDRVDLTRDDAEVYLHDVYAGPGLAGVPRGTVKRLRVLAYHFGYPGLAGPDQIGYGGPWEVMRILGTVPLEADGSANFRVPANTPLAFQALDARGQAVQLMRSWVTAMPGEKLACVGCHETPRDTAPARLASAALRPARDLVPWHGPARGFDFEREVQPVLDRYCVSCHAGSAAAAPDLRRAEQVPDYRGRKLSDLAIQRLHPQIMEQTRGVFRYAPAYDALVPYLRRVNIEDDVSLLVPGEYHAGTSPLMQMLGKGHQGVTLDAEAWDRLVTWIDLNAPCHGTWGEVHPIPDGLHQRRVAMWRQHGGPPDDPEEVPSLPPAQRDPETPRPLPPAVPVPLAGWPLASEQSQRRPAVERREMDLELAAGVALKLIHVPAGQFVMGEAAGEPDERPLAAVAVPAFWMGAFEVTNQQYRCFDPDHDSRYYAKRHVLADDQGRPLDEPQQPVVRVSWQDATAFCRWVSDKTGRPCRLPTEVQWEYACRAGSDTPLSFGGLDADFSPFANLADQRFAAGKQITGGLEQMMLEGALLSDIRFDDGAVVTAPVGSYRPNVWGLHDLHGNAAEWTRSTYRPYPPREDDGCEPADPADRKVVRGGSFFDPPCRARSAYRLAYPAWQRVFNVGFRVVLDMDQG
jgi:formylglycine-generating enzyme required for sulfatase activity